MVGNAQPAGDKVAQPHQSAESFEQPAAYPLSFWAGLWLVLILPVFAVAPLFYPGYIQTHSGYAPLWNVNDLRANWGQFDWTPHVATHFDPLRGDGLLLYYLAAMLPASTITTVKLVMGAALALGSAGMFLWLRSWLGFPGAVIAALVYVYLPHQIAAIYVRGAWGEVMFWGLLPWVILATAYLVTTPKIILLPVAALFWLGMGFTQLGLTLWALIFLISLLLVVHPRQAWLPIISAVVGTSAAVITYLLLTDGIFEPARNLFNDHFLFPFQLLSAQWGFGPSLPGWGDTLSFQLGLAAVGLSMLTLFLWQRGENAAGRADRRLLFFCGAALILILLQFSITALAWSLPLLAGHPLSATLTYPWQLLGLAGLCLSVLAGAALWLDRQLAQWPLFAAIILVVILSVYPYLLPQFVQIDPAAARVPQADFGELSRAELGDAQLVLLAHDFSVFTTDTTVGLERGRFALPLGVYGSPQPGDTLLLNVVWQPLQPFSDNLKVFVHLVDAHNNVIAQFDGYPQEGIHPTVEWIPGEIIADSYPIALPADTPPGPYKVLFGLYDEATFERLPVSGDAEGRVVVDVQ
jgi:hypothetical protein